MFAVLNAKVQLAVATLLDDFQHVVKELERVLGESVDGFCSVNRSSHTIMEASPKMCNLWGEELQGTEFDKLVEIHQRRQLLEAMCDQNINDKSVIFCVTCVAKDLQFDARMTINAVSEQTLAVSVEMVGEKR